MIHVSLYPFSKTDRAIHHAAQITGILIGGTFGGILSYSAGLPTNSIATKMGIIGGSTGGFILVNQLEKKRLMQKYGVSNQIYDIAFSYEYDLSTDQKLILQAAEQKNNPILKKYLTELLQQQLGNDGIEKFISSLQEFEKLYKVEENEFKKLYKKKKRLIYIIDIVIERIGWESLKTIKIIDVGILPIASLYYNITRQISIPERFAISYSLMKAVGFKTKNDNP